MTEPRVDYPRVHYEYRQHYERRKRYVEANGLPCQDCGGRGGEVEPVTDWGQGPWMDCGWCQGTGMVTRWERGMWLREKRRARHD